MSGAHYLAVVALSAASGFAAGLFYFAGLWWTVRALERGGGAVAVLTSAGARLAIVAAALAAASSQGAFTLVVAATGVMAARAIVLWRSSGVRP